MSRRRKILLTLGAVVGAVVFAAWLYHCHLKAVNEAYISQLVAQGEPMSLAQVLPPPVPPSENSADTFLRAAALLKADTSLINTNHFKAMLGVAPGKALVCAVQQEALAYESTNTWPELASAAGRNQAAFDLLRQILRKPALDFHINYLHGMGDSLEFTNLHLGELKKSEVYLSAAAMAALHNGDLTNAVDALRALLAEIDAMKNQRFVISELVRIAMLSDAQKINWEILQEPGCTEVQLASLQLDWERLDLIQGSLDALVVDRPAEEATLRKWRRNASMVRGHIELMKQGRENMGDVVESDSDFEKVAVIIKIPLYQYWWSYPDELRFLKGYDVLLGTLRLLATNECFQLAVSNQQYKLEALKITNIPDDITDLTHSFFANSDFHSLLSKSIVSLAGSLRRLMMAEVDRKMAICAIALQRFKLASGHYPAQLSELVPNYVRVVPLDPVDGQPLRYHLQADGEFLLYSVGENGIDDGGNPTRVEHDSSETVNWLDRKNLDWVWPQAIASKI